MSQKFKNIQGTDYIDTGILDLQDRDDSVLTMFYGDSEPTDKFVDLVWNDTHNKKIKKWDGEEWEELVNYGLNYITKTSIDANYQPLNSKLTTYSNVTSMSSGIGFINTGWVPMSYFFVNNYNDLKTGIGLKDLAYKSKLTTTEISNGSIPNTKINPNLITQPVYVTGDCIPSFNSGNKTGCVKLSKSSSTVYTIGAAASSSTYKGDTYKNLYQLLWSRYSALGLSLYTSAGVKTGKGSSWSSDWSSNKRLELPHIDLPEANAPKNQTMTSGTNATYTISKSGYYKITMSGGGGGGSAYSDLHGTYPDNNHVLTGVCSGSSGGGFSGEILLNEGDVLKYTIGTGGSGIVSHKSGDIVIQASRGASSTLYLKEAGSSSFSKVLTCTGGYGGTINIIDIFYNEISYTSGQPGSCNLESSFSSRFTNKQLITGPSGVGILYGTSEANVKGPFNSNYGAGGAALAVTLTNSYGKDGYSGHIGLQFLAPKEYGTSNSSVKTTLDTLYNGLYYFMKY